MILFKIFQEFLLPSVFIFVLILIGLIFLRSSKKKRTGKILIIAGILFYYLFSITPAADLILLSLESKYQPVEKKELDKTGKIVLLLGEKEASILRAGEVLRMFQYKKFQIIISGTSALNPEENPAKELKDYLFKRGVLAENIILEDKSRNTFESAKNIKAIINKEPFFLVTSAYHLPRSIEIFQKLGNNPIPAPADFKMKQNYNTLDFFPSAENLRKTDLAFHEYFGILFYRIWHY